MAVTTATSYTTQQAPMPTPGDELVTTPTGRWSTSSLTSPSASSDSSYTSANVSIIPLMALTYGSSKPAPGTISFFEPAPRDPNDDGEEAAATVLRTKKPPRKKRSGWGPYQSVLRERSVDFNLTLDIQHLKQEIQTMEMFRTILLSKSLIQRHDPEGSLVRKAKDHYRVLRTGFNTSEAGRKRGFKEQDQVQFIHSIFDPDVDVGNGAVGVNMLIEQIKFYSVFMQFISITMTGFEVITVEDSVLVATRCILHFKITRTTIASMFPHVMGEEWLVAKLVGQEVRADSTMDFFFNAADKVNKFAANLDYVQTFVDILKNPREVDILLGRALITDNCMIGMTNDDLPPPKSPMPAASSESEAAVNIAFEGTDAVAGLDFDAHSQRATGGSGAETTAPPVANSEVPVTTAPAIIQSTSTTQSTKPKAKRPAAKKPARPTSSDVVASRYQLGPLTPAEHFDRVVKQYFLVFANGAESAAAVSEFQRAFLAKHFASTVGYGSVVGRHVVEDRWRSLCWCFGALNFKQLSQEPLAHTPMENLYSIRCCAEYMMQITVRTIEQIFPHLFVDEVLVDAVVGSTLIVSAQLTFWLEKSSGVVASITEQMDFEGALQRIVSRPADLAFVLSRARPTLYGFVGEVVAADPEPSVSATDKAGRDAAPAPDASAVSYVSASSTIAPAKMRLSNILGGGSWSSTSEGNLSAASSTHGSPSSDPSSLVSTSSHGGQQDEDGDGVEGTAGSNSDTATGEIMRWSKKPRRNRSGWGPYKSVLNERSVDFNLTLDVQNLKQEIQNMEMFRDILASKTLLQRHDPNGSLVRVVQEHYRIFRTGFNLQQSGRKRLVDEHDQREFLRSVFAEDVDIGGDENGFQALEQQIMIYTMILKTIGMSLTSFEVVAMDDIVIVATKGILHFQILRSTVAGMFPHVMGEEWLVSKLVGKEVAPEIKITFYFDDDNKIAKFLPELDYVKTFSSVLTDPTELSILFGSLSITENALIVLDDDVDLATLGDPPPSSQPHQSDAVAGVGASPERGELDGDGSSFDGDTEENSSSSPEYVADDSDHGPTIYDVELVAERVRDNSPTVIDLTESEDLVPVMPPSAEDPRHHEPLWQQVALSQPLAPAPVPRRGPMTPVDHFVDVVQNYFRVFAQGSHSSTEAGVMHFLDRYFTPSVRYGDAAGREVLADRWRSLSWCFNVLSFRQVDPTTPAVVYEPQHNRYRIDVRAEYTLLLTLRSVELVFPHVIPDLVLTNLLVGALVVVTSEVTFWLERGTGMLAEMRERMNFECALGAVVLDPEDLAFVIAGAAPILSSFVGEITAAPATKEHVATPVSSSGSAEPPAATQGESSPGAAHVASLASAMAPPPITLPSHHPPTGAPAGTAALSAKKKAKRRAPQQQKKHRKPKAGWGPYRTVVNERAVAFNLTLDVQHLEQEVRSLTAARDILLATRALHRRHDPTGSLMRVVAAYYDLLRKGITLDSSLQASRSHSGTTGVVGCRPPPRMYSQKEQREFLRSFVDPEIDCGGGLVGADVFFEQLLRYSVFLRFVDFMLLSFEIVNADDSVLITTSGLLHIQILRSTIAGVFPHVLGYEWLVSKLVGREVTLATTLSFYFTPRDQVAKYVVDLDFFKAFADLLADPEDVAILFGRALIGANCMFAAAISDDTTAAPAESCAHPPTIRRAVSTRDAPAGDALVPAVVREVRVLPPASIYSVAGTRSQELQPSRSARTSDFYSRVISEYFDAFSRVTRHPETANGAAVLSDAQQAFVAQWVAPQCEFGDDVDEHGAALLVGRHVLGARWCDVADCFDVLAFARTAQDPVVAQPDADLCFVRASAAYALRLTRRSIRRAFPHVASEPLLLDALLGREVTARAELKFWLERRSGELACVKEAIDFGAALAPLVAHPDDLAWVLAGARLDKFSVRRNAIPARSSTSRETGTSHGPVSAPVGPMASYDISI
ncbi:hypothetical protein PybrP1_002499 [[Pythium] brassicae (nom. inval.)]|nr:hypothetical protein PybrP1_002499 [[Pythium] brassicae (nom. inval.)]